MKTISSHLSKELRIQFKRRSLPVRVGDEVQIMRGQHTGKSGKISRVDTKKKKIYITGIVDKRTVGTEVQIPIDPSKIRIINPDLADEKRRKMILRKVKEVKYEKPKIEKKEEKAKEVKEETKTKEKEVEEKHEVEKIAGTKVLETAQKRKTVGGKSKAGPAQKV